MRPFPRHILPYKMYHLISKEDIRLQLGQHYLLRYADKGAALDMAKLSELYQSSKYYHGLSTCLLGEYTLKDVEFVITQKKEIYSTLWGTKKAKGVVPRAKYPKKHHFRHVHNHGYIGFNIGDLLSQKLDYNAIDKQGLPEDFKTLQFECVHEPTRSNFWHFSIYIKIVYVDMSSLVLNPQQEMYSEKMTQRLAKNLCKVIKNENLVCLAPNLVERYIPEKIYK